jgi:adenylate kinase
LKQALEMAHISTGDMLRERIAAGDGLGREVAVTIQAGGLVPDETVNRMVEERIELEDCKTGFILDGFPRTVEQAKLLVGLLAARRVRQVVIHLKVDYNVIIARLAGRRQCPTCGALYSLTSNAPTVSEGCDYDGSKLIVRDDDREEVVRERLRAYERQTTPVLDFLRSAGYKVWDVQGADAPPAAIAKRIVSLVQRERGQAG